jgi:monoamine oxidase
LGATEDTTDALREPEWDGKLIFCGEATNSEHEGSVHSALMSGRRAAKEISDLLDQWAA